MLPTHASKLLLPLQCTPRNAGHRCTACHFDHHHKNAQTTTSQQQSPQSQSGPGINTARIDSPRPQGPDYSARPSTMDLRRPTRPPNPTARRNVFSSRRTHLNHTMSSSSTVHIPSEDAAADDNELVAKENGEYKMLVVEPQFRPSPAIMQIMKDHKNEHENQLIGLYEKQDAHWADPAIQNEIKTALKSSLAKKMNSLETDRWVFEGDRK